MNMAARARGRAVRTEHTGWETQADFRGGGLELGHAMEMRGEGSTSVGGNMKKPPPMEAWGTFRKVSLAAGRCSGWETGRQARRRWDAGRGRPWMLRVWTRLLRFAHENKNTFCISFAQKTGGRVPEWHYLIL